MHTDHTALTYRLMEPPFIKPSSYAPDKALLHVQADDEILTIRIHAERGIHLVYIFFPFMGAFDAQQQTDSKST